MPDARATARELHDAGFSVVRVKEDGSKHPDGPWKKYQGQRSTSAEHDAWFGPDRHGRVAQGIGAIFGAISDNSEMLEFEGPAIDEGYLDQVTEIAEASGLGEVLKAVLNGWVEQSPKGGIHAHLRVDGAPVKRNTKLASRPKRDDELTPEEVLVRIKEPAKVFPLVLIETRGEGGFSVLAPSHGRVHPTGEPYVRLTGGPATIPTISAEEYAALHALMRCVDQMPVKETSAPAPKDLRAPLATGELRPGDDFENRTPWADILIPHGWQFVCQGGETGYWRRPGKSIGISATSGHARDRDRFYVFSTSTEFTAETPYTKFAAYTLLNHGGDYRAASRELRRLGFGTQQSSGRMPAATRVDQAPAQETIEHFMEEPPMEPPEDDPFPEWELSEAEMAHTEPEFGIGEPVPFHDAPQPWDDLGNGQRLLDRYAPIIRWVLMDKGGRWAVYDGKRWDFEGGDTLVRTLVRKTVESLPDGELLRYDDKPTTDPLTGKPKPSEQDRFKAFIHASRDSRAMGRATVAAATFQRVHARVSDFDANHRYLNLPNGVLDTDTVRLLAHDPDLMLSKMFATPYNPRATAPTWLNFLEVNVPNVETRRYLQKMSGYSLTGRADAKVLPYLHGPRDTGKSIYTGIMLRLVGRDYGVPAADGALRPRREGQISNDIDDMAGKRFVTTSESRPGEAMDEALVKRLTGRDQQRTRALYANNRDWIPECVIWVCSNQYPRITGNDDAIWGRIKVVPFKVQFLEGDPSRDEQLQAKIELELEGVMAWAVEGLRMYLREGLTPPPEVVMASEAFRASADGVSMYLAEAAEDEKITVRAGTWINRTELHQMYKAWCEAEEQDALKPAKFYERLEALGYSQSKRNGTRGFEGIGLCARTRSPR